MCQEGWQTPPNGAFLFVPLPLVIYFFHAQLYLESELRSSHVLAQSTPGMTNSSGSTPKIASSTWYHSLQSKFQ